MEPKCWEVVRGERGFGGSGEYSDENDAPLDIIGVFYHEASGGKYLPREGLLAAVQMKPVAFNFFPLYSCRIVLLVLRQCRGAAGNGLGTRSEFLRRTTSGAAGNGQGTTANWQTTSGAAGNGHDKTIKYIRHTTSGAAGIGLGTRTKFLRGATGIGLYTTRSTCDAR